MNIFYIYILKCADDSYYIGHTDNLEKRLSEHYDGYACLYTKSRLPVKLVYSEIFSTRTEALNAEHKIKKWTRFKKELLINEGWQSLQSWKILRKNK